ncbi:MAG: hypothetical protein M0R80_23070 [Proteobacteria bacterium]|nr:hypothetical protein [Pseudomonadota bacterium]
MHDKDGKIDCDAADCWFRNDTHVRGLFGSYCWFRGKCLDWALEFVGEEELAARCYKNLSAIRAGQFGRRLLKLADTLRKKPRSVAHGKQANGAKSKKSSGHKHEQELETSSESDYEEALKTIEGGGRWYGKVAELGSGVKAWF